MTRISRNIWLSVVILLVAAGMRLVALQDVPPGLSQDEVLNADIVEGIRQGKHALFFREGFGHEPLYHYFSVPFQVLLGDNVLSIRLPAVFLGLILVAVSMRWARREFGSWVALVAGIGLAVSWWPIVFSRVGIRPILVPVLLVLSAWFWQKKPVLAGIFLALTLYTYTPALVFFALPLAMIGYNLIRRQSFRNELIIFVTAILLYFPLFLYLRANPDLLERGDQLRGPLDALLQGDWQPLWQTTRATLGVFAWTGDPRWTYGLPNEPLFAILTAILFGIGLIIAMRSMRNAKYFFLAAWLFIGLLPSALTPDAPSTIRMIGALPATYILLGLPIELVKNHRLRWLFLLIGVGWLVRTVDTGFMTWAQAFETRADKYQSIYLDIARAIEPDSAIVINDAGFAPIDADSMVRNLGEDRPIRWTQGGTAIILPPEGATFFVPEFAPIAPPLFDAIGVDPALPAYRSTQSPAFATYTLPTAPTTALLDEPIVFADHIVLVGYEWLPISAENPIQLITFWHVLKPLPDDLSIFTHLALAPNAPPVTQDDRLDAIATTLQSGDHFLQLHTIPVPPDTDQAYFLNLGLYTRTDAQRLPYDQTTQTVLTLDELVLFGR